MQIYTNGEVAVFIPIIGELDWLKPGPSIVAYQILIVIEVLMIIYNTLFASLAIGIWRESSVFHRNLLNLGVVMYFNAYLHAISRSILLLVQLKLLVPNDAEFATFTNIVITAASVVRCYQGSTVMILFASLVIERFFATIFLNDYEQKSRRWISIMLISFTILLSSGMALSRTFNSATLTTPIFNAIGYAYGIIPSIIGIVIVVFNYRRLHRILLSPRYSLSAKFQLQENMRAFKFLLYCMLWAVATAAIAAGIFHYSDLYQDDFNVVTLCGAAFETATTITYACSVSTTFFSIHEWRTAMRRKLRRHVSLCRRQPPTEIPSTPRKRPSLRGKRVESENDVYFADLTKSWNKRLEATEVKKKRQQYS